GSGGGCELSERVVGRSAGLHHRPFERRGVEHVVALVGHPCRVVERRAFEMQVFPHGPDCNAWTWMSGVDQMTVCVGVVTWGRLRRHERPIRARAGPAWLPGAAIC